MTYITHMKRKLDITLAKFLGASLHPYPGLNRDILQWSSLEFSLLHDKISGGNELKFSTELDWLIPVAKKFLSIGIDKFKTEKSKAEYNTLCVILRNQPFFEPIENIYEDVVSSVLWYNENK